MRTKWLDSLLLGQIQMQRKEKARDTNLFSINETKEHHSLQPVWKTNLPVPVQEVPYVESLYDWALRSHAKSPPPCPILPEAAKNKTHK